MIAKEEFNMFGYLNTTPLIAQKIVLRSSIILMLCMGFCHAEEIQFNTDVLDIKDKNNIDLSKFSQAGYIMPGTYVFDININGQDNVISDESIDWLISNDDPEKSVPCLTHKLVDEFGLRDEFKSKLTWWHDQQCLVLKSLAGMTTRGDLGSETLYINLPQAYIEYQTPNWDPPSRWDDGVPGVLFDYYLSGQSIENTGNSGGKENNLSGNGTAGINAGAWRFRADWQARYDRNDAVASNHNFDWSRYYVYRAFRHLKAKFTLGEDSVYSDIFDSFRFVGASLVSDDNMLPPNLRNYAPEITGIARTNAKVIISQQGRIIEQTQVAAGPFRINDLNDMISGLLDVRVEEQDGSVQTFTVNTASIPYLTRPGRLRYKLFMGRSSNHLNKNSGPEFTSGEFSWGVSNGWSLYGGGIGADGYGSLALGIGRDLLALGALSFDVNQSRAKIPQHDSTLKGQSYRLSYSKRFDETDSQVTFAGYRFNQKDFMSMSDYLSSLEGDRDEGHGKEMYTISFNQQISDLNLSAYLDYSHQTYWNRPPDDRYTLSLASYFDVFQIRNLSFSATVFRNKYYNTHDKGMYLSLSIPWGSKGTMTYSGNTAHNNNTQQISYYGETADGDSYQLSSGKASEGLMSSAYWGHDANIAHIDANIDYRAGRYRSVSLSAKGGATATAYGAALHRINLPGGARLMIDTDGSSGVPVQGFGSDTLSNRFGKAVVADVNSYYRNRVKIDLDKLPDNIDVNHSVVDATLTEGAIGYRKFDVVSGAKGMAIVRLADGSYPAFGATVRNSEHRSVGIVGDQGSVYLIGMYSGAKMSIISDNNTCTIVLPTPLPQDTSQNQLFLPCQVQ